MLRALKKQLKVLALDEDNKFHEALRKRVGKRATELFENRTKQLILLMPDVVERIHYYYGHMQKDDSRTKKLGGYLLTYLYHPKDLIGDEWGLLGYLDDAYFAAVVFEKIIKEVAKEDQLLVEPNKEFNESLRHLKVTVRSVIPKEAQKIDQMVEEIIKGEMETFTSMFR
ncbi:MAG TPA: hypothetical protein PLB05_10750 [Candidatus Omnitrophota bacterium]|nr:hypothetical protein [Candidatus Omnitrophota bacterium]